MRINAKRLVVAMFSLVAVGAVPPTLADQTDPALDGHFSRLRAATNDATALEAERAITRLWHRGTDQELTSGLNKARKLIETWAFEEAMTLLDELVERAPRFAEAWNQRATLHYIQRRYDQSLADVERTLKLEPRHFGALAGRGEIHLRLGELAKALSAFEEALAIHPRLPALRGRVEALRAMVAARELQ